VAGIPLFVDALFPAFLAVAAWWGWRQGRLMDLLAVLGALLIAVLLHEFAHAFAARRRGLVVPGIVLHFVSVTWVREGSEEDHWRIALAGPLASLALGGLLLLVAALLGDPVVADPEAMLGRPLLLLAAANLLLGLNLLPVLPLDGGRALRSWLRARGLPRLALLLSIAGPVAAALAVALLVSA
jgi:Zn-dependent protease